MNYLTSLSLHDKVGNTEVQPVFQHDDMCFQDNSVIRR